MTEMSYHCREDRVDRLVYIATTVGWGEPILQINRQDAREILTDTGVIMIKALDRDFLITAYIASIDKVTAMYRRSMGDKRLPEKLYSKVQHNKKYWKNQNKA